MIGVRCPRCAERAADAHDRQGLTLAEAFGADRDAEFPSMEQARRWYDSDEYRPLSAQRLAAARGSVVLVAGG